MESHIFRKAVSREMEVSFPPAHGPREQNVAEVGLKYVLSRAKKSTGQRKGAGAPRAPSSEE